MPQRAVFSTEIMIGPLARFGISGEEKSWTGSKIRASCPSHQERTAVSAAVLPTGPGAATVDRAKTRMCEAPRPRTKALPKTTTDLMPGSVFRFHLPMRKFSQKHDAS